MTFTSRDLAVSNERSSVWILVNNELEQYCRRPLVCVSGIPETSNEFTAGKIIDVVSAADIRLQRNDISNSHRVGKPKRNGTRSGQIISRFKSVDLKLHRSKFKEIHEQPWHKRVNNPDTKYVKLNEDLTNHRGRIMFLGRNCAGIANWDLYPFRMVQ